MRDRRRLVRGLVIIGVLALLVWRYGFALRTPVRGPALPAAAQPGQGLFSGTIEADEVRLSAERGGRVAEVTVEEGDTVAQGQVLVRLDTTLLDDQVATAEAQLAVARAALQRIEAGARPGALQVARAQEAQAVAARDAARQAQADADAIRREPQQLALQVAVAEQQLVGAEARVQQAIAQRDLAQMGVDALGYARNKIDSLPDKVPVPGHPGLTIEVDKPGIPLTLQLAPYDWWQAWAGLNAATAARDGARDRLAQLKAQLTAPQALNAQADAATAAFSQAEAAVQVAHAQVVALAAGATAEQLAAAQARVAQAQAALDALRVERSRMEIAAPLDATILVRQVEPGEVAAMGAPLLTLAGLQQVALTLYLPEQDLGLVGLGQGVRVSVDSYPGRIFPGEVVHIADRAEYTPRNVATPQERINTFYAVKVLLPNPDGALKPGMPADASLAGVQP